MTFTESLKEGWEIVKLNKEAYHRTSANPETFTWALVITAIGGVAAGLGPGMITRAGFLWAPVGSLVGLFIGVGILHLLATLFGGKGDFMGLIRIAGLANILAWPRIIPFIGNIASLWMLPVMFIALQEHYKLDTTKAIIVLLIPVAFFGFLLILGAIVGVAFLGAFMGR